MSSTQLENLSHQKKNELICAYASIILHDGKKPVDIQGLNGIIKASGNNIAEKYLTSFARAVQGQDISQFFCKPEGGEEGGEEESKKPPKKQEPKPKKDDPKKEEPKKKDEPKKEEPKGNIL